MTAGSRLVLAPGVPVVHGGWLDSRTAAIGISGSPVTLADWSPSISTLFLVSFRSREKWAVTLVLPRGLIPAPPAPRSPPAGALAGDQKAEYLMLLLANPYVLVKGPPLSFDQHAPVKDPRLRRRQSRPPHSSSATLTTGPGRTGPARTYRHRCWRRSWGTGKHGP